MFRKLKEKITEEVKSSPQRIQQFTQSVSDKLQNSSQSDDNLFSISGEDDTSSTVEAGFSNISLTSSSEDNTMSHQRRNSNSSIASDVSFLPRYESMANMYHLQSDLDISASELEDNASTTSQLGHLTKEQIYAAFQKAQMRYHKYRGRYTDLAKHYKDLERENGKMKSVLVETQDKAIRRLTDLKDQCVLEQKAKAHLEGALRDELDEKQFKIQALETKVGLLQQQINSGGVGSGDTNDLLMVNNSGQDLAVLTKDLNEARNEIENLNQKLQEFKANSIIFQSKEQEYKLKIGNLEKELELLNEREKENNFKIAESKMELHNELINKETEINKLKKDNELLKSQIDQNELLKLNENLQIQNKKLIEKLENLTIKSNNYDNDLIKLEQYQIEIKNLLELNRNNEEELKLKNSELEQLRNETKINLINLEENIRQELLKQSHENEEKLKLEYETKFEKITRNLNNLQTIQNELIEKDEQINNCLSELNTTREELKDYEIKYKNLEGNHLELIQENQLNLTTIKETSNELNLIKTKHENELIAIKDENNKLESENFKMEQTIKELEAKVHLNEEKEEAIDLDNTETKLLELKLQTLEEERDSLLKDFENERELFEQQFNEQTKDLNHKLRLNENELKEIENEKLKLEELVQELQEKNRLWEEKDEAIDLDNTETKLLELKLQKMEEEREKLLKEFENERQVLNGLINDNNELKLIKEQNKILENKLKANELELKTSHDKFIKIRDENNFVQKLNFDQEQEINELQKQIRLWEEKDEAIDLDNTETKLLEMKLQQMEQERENLLKEFEMEREMFEELLKDTNKLNECKNEVKRLEEALNITNEIVDTLNQKLNTEEERYQQLYNENLKLELINKEKIDMIEINIELERKMFDEIKENKIILEENCNLLKNELDEFKHLNQQLLDDKIKLQETIKGLQIIVESDRLELNEIKINIDLLEKNNQKLELQLNELLNEKQLLLDEINDLRMSNKVTNTNDTNKTNEYLKEIEILKDKLIKYKSLDLTNRNSIEFYENELQKLNNKNEKLHQKLDETIVTLNHCTDLSNTTETEYLKNVLYNYMIGKESLVLARVIAAVCKFDKQQTDTILQKEQQKQTLLGQLGIL